MDESKKPWASKAMWAGVVALLALNARTFGIVDINETDQQTITEIIVRVIENGAVLAAMYGRIIATKKVSM